MQRQQGALTYFVGIDGSDSSEMCFQYCLKSIIRHDQDVKDTIIAGTISDKRKDSYLPWNMRTNYLHDCYSAKVIPLGSNGRFV
jgi:hypothetical protein